MKIRFAIQHSLIFLLALSACQNRSSQQTAFDKVHKDTATPSYAQQQNDTTHYTELPKGVLTAIYAQAIADYIRLVNKTYKIVVDTLYFGKHANGQDTDFPDIELPPLIEHAQIRLVSPIQGEKHQRQHPSSFYINLFAWANSYNADFNFVTFSDGFVHQFDCTIQYKWDTSQGVFIMKSSRLENNFGKSVH